MLKIILSLTVLDCIFKISKLQTTEHFSKYEPINLRIMTFNTFLAGSQVIDGIRKIAHHVQSINADVVGFQEIDNFRTDQILNLLGPGWIRCSDPKNLYTHLDVTIITRHPAVPFHPINNFSNTGCRIFIGGLIIDFWNFHLLYTNYGPYVACFSQQKYIFNRLNFFENFSPFSYIDSRVTSVEKFIGYEANFFGSNAAIVMGDFNVPSHLDWIPNAKNLHCNVSFDWPVSKLLEKYGFLDSFRVIK